MSDELNAPAEIYRGFPGWKEVKAIVNARRDGTLKTAEEWSDVIAKDAEIARLKAQRDALAHGVYSYELTASRHRGPDEAKREADSIMADEYGVRIINGQVEEVK